MMARYRRAKAQISHVDTELAEREDSGVQLDEPPSPHSKQQEEYFEDLLSQHSSPKSSLISVTRKPTTDGHRSSQVPLPLAKTRDRHARGTTNSSVGQKQLSTASRSSHVISSVRDLPTSAQERNVAKSSGRREWHSYGVRKSQDDFENVRRGVIVEKTKTLTKSPSIEEDEGLGIKEISSEVEEVCSKLHEFRVEFSTGYSPDNSDNETKNKKSGEKSPPHTDGTVHGKESNAKEKDSRKRRFRKLISRPLRRSHSAGCAKDLEAPHHALFLQYDIEGKTSDKKYSSSATGTSGGSKHTYLEPTSPGGTSGTQRGIHKTSSADATMMALEGISDPLNDQSPSKTKSKSSIARTVKRRLKFLKRRNTDSFLGDAMMRMARRKISRGEALEWSKSFDSLLFDKVGLELFRDFLKSEYSEENLDFWIACEEFKSTEAKKVPSRANQIFSEYIAIKAPKEINLDSKTRLTTETNIENPSAISFCAAQKRIQSLMEKDSYPRFLESEIYTRLTRTDTNAEV